MNKKKSIKSFLKLQLNHFKLRKGIDYTIRDGVLNIAHIKGITGVILVTLKENFPEFSFYWETPRKLVWF